MKFKIPYSDNVLVEIDSIEEHYDAAGLLKCADGWQGMPHSGTVVARGPGRWARKGVRRMPMDVRKGDRVMLAWRGGKVLKNSGNRYRMISETEIWGVIEDEVAA